MKSSVASEHSFFIVSEDEDEDNKEFNKGGEEDGNDSDSSTYSNENQDPVKPNSLNTTSWPQSYRSAFFSILI